MAFKLRSSGLQMDNTPIYQVDMDDNVLGTSNDFLKKERKEEKK
jgi:hypothetical protein